MVRFCLFFATLLGSNAALARFEDGNSCQRSSVGVVLESSFLGFVKDYQSVQSIPPSAEAGVQSAAVFGKDNRVPLPIGRPWGAIGKLYFDGNKYCTATLINKCYALTAGHCVADETGRALDTDQMIFHSSDGVSTANVERFYFGHYNSNMVNDWGVVKLDSNLAHKIGSFGMKKMMGASFDPSNEYIIAGFNADVGSRGEYATEDEHVHILSKHADKPNLIMLRGNTYKGSSGGPIFYIDEQGMPWIVGVNVKGYSEPDKQVYLPANTTDPNQLARGIATSQFWDQIMDFMSKYPCDEDR